MTRPTPTVMDELVRVAHNRLATLRDEGHDLGFTDEELYAHIADLMEAEMEDMLDSLFVSLLEARATPARLASAIHSHE